MIVYLTWVSDMSDDKIEKTPEERAITFIKAIRGEVTGNNAKSGYTERYVRPNLTADKIKAILALSTVGDKLDSNRLYLIADMIVNSHKHRTPEDADKSKKLIKILLLVNETCDSLVKDTKDGHTSKSETIKNSAVAFKASVFFSSYSILESSYPNIKKSHLDTILNAAKQFEQDATSIDRGTMRKAMQIIVNTTLHVTGLFLITNTLNQALTGNYLFFNDTLSTQALKKTTTNVVSELTKPATEEDAHAKEQEDNADENPPGLSNS